MNLILMWISLLMARGTTTAIIPQANAASSQAGPVSLRRRWPAPAYAGSEGPRRLLPLVCRALLRLSPPTRLRPRHRARPERPVRRSEDCHTVLVAKQVEKIMVLRVVEDLSTQAWLGLVGAGAVGFVGGALEDAEEMSRCRGGGRGQWQVGVGTLRGGVRKGRGLQGETTSQNLSRRSHPLLLKKVIRRAMTGRLLPLLQMVRQLRSSGTQLNGRRWTDGSRRQ